MLKTVVLAALTYDPLGYLEVQTVDSSASDLDGLTRRVTRTPTLDGGASVNDAGYSAADRTVLVQFDASTDADKVEAARRMLRLYSSIWLSTADGIFLACPSSMRPSNGHHTLTLLITEALVEDY